MLNVKYVIFANCMSINDWRAGMQVLKYLSKKVRPMASGFQSEYSK